MPQAVNNLSLLYEPKCHTKTGLMRGSNFGPRLYDRIMTRNVCFQNYVYKFKTELYKYYCKIFI